MPASTRPEDAIYVPLLPVLLVFANVYPPTLPEIFIPFSPVLLIFTTLPTAFPLMLTPF